MGNNNNKKTRANWREQLREFRSKLVDDMSPEEIKIIEHEEIERTVREQRFQRREKMLKSFLYGFKYSSDIWYNNFFRKRKTESFDYWELHGYRQELCYKRDVWDDKRDQVIVHCPINKYTVDELINLAIMIELSPPLEKDTTFYRGCVDIDENGVNGIVSVTSDKRIAEKFSKGALLSIIVPKGTRILDVSSFLSEEERCKEFDKTFILPPCNYVVLSESEKEKGNEPNNSHKTTKHLTIEVTPLDLLEEFMKVLNDPPENYALVRSIEEKWYEDAKLAIDENRADDGDLERVNAGNYEETVGYLERYLARRNQKIKSGVKVYSKTNQ